MGGTYVLPENLLRNSNTVVESLPFCPHVGQVFLCLDEHRGRLVCVRRFFFLGSFPRRSPTAFKFSSFTFEIQYLQDRSLHFIGFAGSGKSSLLSASLKEISIIPGKLIFGATGPSRSSAIKSPSYRMRRCVIIFSLVNHITQTIPGIPIVLLRCLGPDLDMLSAKD